MNMKRILTSGAMGSALLLASLTPALAATDVTISGNGANSTNKVSLVNKCRTTATQDNNSNVGIILGVTQSTGDNTANGNTGGDVKIDTGKATSGVTFTVGGDSNTLASSDCCCTTVDTTDVTIKNNGDASLNVVKEKSKVKVKKEQKNKKTVGVVGGTTQGTGNNETKNNTNGTVDVFSGDTDSTITGTVGGNTNTL